MPEYDPMQDAFDLLLADETVLDISDVIDYKGRSFKVTYELLRRNDPEMQSFAGAC